MSSIQLVKISQTFNDDCISDVERIVRSQISGVGLKFQPGASIAIAVGSRGIANLAHIVRITVEYVRELRGQPFIVPAMGSHGGATAEGQQQVLASYAVTETFTEW